MSKALVAFFSASGVTKKLSEKLLKPSGRICLRLFRSSCIWMRILTGETSRAEAPLK